MFSFGILSNFVSHNRNYVVIDISSGTFSIFVVRKGKIEYTSKKNIDKNISEALISDIEVYIDKEKKVILNLIGEDVVDMPLYVFTHAPFTKIKPLSKKVTLDKAKKITTKLIKKQIECKEGNKYFVYKIVLNGYDIQLPVNFKSKEFEIFYMKIFTDKKSIMFLEKIASFFGKKLDQIMLFDFDSSVYAAAMNYHLSSYILLDMGEYYTRTIVVKNNKIQVNSVVDFGTDSLIKDVSSNLGISDTIARAKLKLYNDNTILPYWKKRIEPIIDKYKEDLKKYFEENFGVISEEYGYLPNTLFLFSNSIAKRIVQSVLNKESLYKYNVSISKFYIADIIKNTDKYYSSDVLNKDAKFVFELYFIEKVLPKNSDMFIIC